MLGKMTMCDLNIYIFSKIYGVCMFVLWGRFSTMD